MPGDLGGLPPHIPTLPALLAKRNYSSLLLGRTTIDKSMAMAMPICILPYTEKSLEMTMRRELFAGKWHLGVGADGESLPTRRGFQQYLGVILFHLSIMIHDYIYHDFDDYNFKVFLICDDNVGTL